MNKAQRLKRLKRLQKITPKFAPVYTITGIKDATKKMDFSSSRLFGWYPKLDWAVDEVENNSCDINEAGHYRHVVIEELQWGLYGMTTREVWFEFNNAAEKYEKINKPPCLDGVICFYG
jgi:hypothetical protein